MDLLIFLVIQRGNDFLKIGYGVLLHHLGRLEFLGSRNHLFKVVVIIEPQSLAKASLLLLHLPPPPPPAVLELQDLTRAIECLSALYYPCFTG